MTGNGATFKKPISCSKCGKLFTSRNNLNTHEKIHTGEKPFACSKCDKKFSQTSHLNKHERIHTDEKPFSCSKCDYKCKASGDLKTHERIHTDEKPFSCSKCHLAASRLVKNEVYSFRDFACSKPPNFVFASKPTYVWCVASMHSLDRTKTQQ